jgi:hypothetical protein
MTDNQLGSGSSLHNVWINAGAGPRENRRHPKLFEDWREVRVDIDVGAEPDIVADITDLSPISTGFADALWSSHCLEHLFQHQVIGALKEFRRVIADSGFIVCLVPDLQAVAGRIAADKFHEPIYQSPAGPVTPHDMFYGHGPSIARGHTSMAHRCGFTPTILVELLNGAGFAQYIIRRRPSLELVVVARKTAGSPSNNPEALLRALEL